MAGNSCGSHFQSVSAVGRLLAVAVVNTARRDDDDGGDAPDLTDHMEVDAGEEEPPRQDNGMQCSLH